MNPPRTASRLTVMAIALVVPSSMTARPMRDKPVAHERHVRDSPSAVNKVPEQTICLTSGGFSRAPNGPLSNEGSKLRAYVDGSGGHHAALRFRYKGPTDKTTRLHSGRLRSQIGLKLLAED